MGQHTTLTKEFILQRMVNKVVAQTDLNDLNDGSSIKQVLAAAAREDDELHYQMYNLKQLFDIDQASNNDLDERANEVSPDLIYRRTSAFATGAVVFSRQSIIGTITIPIGTQVKVPPVGAQAAILYKTTALGTISAGNQDSNSVDITALVAGTSGNVDPVVINGFVSKPSGVDTVENPASLTNGASIESDDSFRSRIKAYINSLARSHVSGLEYAALTAVDPITSDRVIFANVVEDTVDRGDVIIYIDDGSGTVETNVIRIGTIILASAVGGEIDLYTPEKPIKEAAAFTLYINTIAQALNTDYTFDLAAGHIKLTQASYPTGLTVADAVTMDYTAFTGLIAETQKIIDGDTGDRTNYPGYRAAGVLVKVLPPQIAWITVQANITVLQGFSQTDAATTSVAAISQYINNLGISEDVILNEIRERIMAIPGMYDVEISIPTENTVVLDDQLARILASSITVA